MIKLGGINGNHSGHILETETIRLTDDFNPELNHHHILKHFQSIFSLGFSLTSLSLHHFFFFFLVSSHLPHLCVLECFKAQFSFYPPSFSSLMTLSALW